MRNFKDADQLMSSTKNEMFWDESEVDLVRNIFEKFDDADWQELEKTLPFKPDQWKARCAQSLSAILSERSYKLLLTFLDSQDYWTVVRAIESLDEFENKFRAYDYVSTEVVNRATLTIQKYQGNEEVKTYTLTRLNSLFQK